MLFPPTRFLGGLSMAASFVFIASQIRLGFLCEMVILLNVMFFHPGSLGDVAITAIMPVSAPVIATPAPAWLVTAMTVFLWAYLALLPIARVGLSYNLLMKKTLPGWLQKIQDVYTNVFGLILWRVFSADHTNFFINIYELTADGQRRLISTWSEIWRYHNRFNQVAEGITVTTLFTTLKYYPSNQQIFRDRLLRYSRTVPRTAGSRLVYEHVAMVKRADRFDQVPAAEFIVDVDRETIEEITLDPSISVRAPISASPVHEAARPGTYAPLRG
jgi:hypothetical protein